MATRTVLRKVKVKTTTRVEAWDTKHGASARVVVRDTNGKFVTNVSLGR